jgi:hypothetical protein
MTTWVRSTNILAFPYKWQEPAATEKWVYEYFLKNPIESKFVEFICFPWATLIDLISREIWSEVNFLIDALKSLPPKKTLIRATACQHIDLSAVLDHLLSIKVTDLYWSHKIVDVNFIKGFRLHPLPLYPLSYFKFPELKYIPIRQRKYLFSFVGAYDEKSYLSTVRSSIFNFPKSTNCVLIKRDAWHLDALVYKKQILGGEIDKDEQISEREKSIEYVDILQNTIFSLCPSGTGPNTIRYWESLAHGCIPVILSDTWDKPPISEEWIDIRYPENQVHSLVNYIQGIYYDSFGVAPNSQAKERDFPFDWLTYMSNELENSENILKWTKIS